MTDPRLAIVVLAAGQGTRMKSATPKILHLLAGIPIVGHVLDTATALAPAHTIVVVRHERDAVSAAILERMPSAIIVDQDDVPGTGRAAEIALSALPEGFDGDVVIVSGDTPLLDSATLGRLIDEHRLKQAGATLLTAIFDEPHGYGRVIRGEHGDVDAIVEQKDATDDQLLTTEINSGTYVFNVAQLAAHLAEVGTENAQHEKYLTDVVGLFRASGSVVAAMPVPAPWVVAGVNDRAQLSDVAVQLNRLIVRGWQVAGVTIHDPASTWIDRDVVLAEDVEIFPGTQLKGATKVDTGAHIGPETTLVDTEVGAGATVKRTDATLAVIGAGASVGPFAYLRAGAIVGEDGKVGTYVEIKNSTIGRGSKVPHLSYVGDTTIGEYTNLGAGAITANYDDLVKHRTEIGSHVHSGSHNVFVAPVRIGDGAKTGAGTVVRKDVPPGALAINVAPQRNMTGWVEEHRAGTASADAAAASNK